MNQHKQRMLFGRGLCWRGFLAVYGISINTDKPYFLSIRNAKVASSIPASGTSNSKARSDAGLFLFQRGLSPGYRQKRKQPVLAIFPAENIFSLARSFSPDFPKAPSTLPTIKTYETGFVVLWRLLGCESGALVFLGNTGTVGTEDGMPVFPWLGQFLA